MGPAFLLVAVFAMAAPASPAPVPATVLVGQSWLGLWHDGHVVATREEPGWRFNASRLSVDGRAIEVAAQRETADTATVLRFDARTLAPRGWAADRAAASQSAAAPVGTDEGVPDATAEAGSMVMVPAADGLMVNAAGVRTGGIGWAPDGSTAAAFRMAGAAGARWRGEAWDVRSGRAIAAPGLFVDDGTTRENGAALALACLLPRGEGAIFTFVGQPADRMSEFQSFRSPRRAATELPTPYVMNCLAPAGNRR